jgi:hypothetical protein
MAGRRDVSRAPAPSTDQWTNEIIDAYLAELGARLHGPASARTAVVHEVGAGLEDSTDELMARGVGATAAARAAIAEVGSAADVADAFAGELAIVHARQVLRILLLTGPLVGVWWFLLLAPATWQGRPGLLIAAIPALPFVAAAVVAIALGLATTGSLIRWVPEATPFRATILTATVGLACVVGDLTVLALLVGRSATGATDTLSLGLAVAAVTASLVRLPFAVWATASFLQTARRLRHGSGC